MDSVRSNLFSTMQHLTSLQAAATNAFELNHLLFRRSVVMIWCPGKMKLKELEEEEIRTHSAHNSLSAVVEALPVFDSAI